MSRRKLKVYLSAPVSGKVQSEVTYQFMVAESQAKNAGYDVINPLVEGVTALGWKANWIDYMKLDIPLLASSDCVWFFSNEPDSDGVAIERAIAESFKIKIIEL